MKAIDIGSVCVKTMGREAGRRVVVLEAIDKNTVVVQGLLVRKRKCGIAHLFPMGKKVSVTKNMTQKELRDILFE